MKYWVTKRKETAPLLKNVITRILKPCYNECKAINLAEKRESQIGFSVGTVFFQQRGWLVKKLKKQEIIDYWKDTSSKDYITMLNLFNSKDFHWSLFMGHLVIEKLLKALYLKNTEDNSQPPRTHDLLLLAVRAKIDPSERQQDLLDRITTFNISARYPDYRYSFYKKCSSDYTEERIAEIKEMRKWLLKELLMEIEN